MAFKFRIDVRFFHTKNFINFENSNFKKVHKQNNNKF